MYYETIKKRSGKHSLYEIDYFRILDSFSSEQWATESNMKLLKNEQYRHNLNQIFNKVIVLSLKIKMSDKEFEEEILEASHQFFRMALN